MKKLKYLLLIFIIFITPNVFAADINVNQYVRPTINGDTGKYWGLESYNGGIPANYKIGTRYNGRLSKLEYFINPYGFEYGYTYTITMNMATDDWRNNFGSSYYWDCDREMTNINAHVFVPSYVSYKKIKFTFTPTENTGCLRVLLYSKNQSSSQYFTGTSNWNLSSVIVNDPAYGSGGSGGGSGGSGGTTDPNQSVIDNANQNTQDIINNNNKNTTDIIDNNNENTQKIVDELTNCRESNNLFDESLLLNASGWTYSNGYYTGASSTLFAAFGLNTNGFLNSFLPNTQYTITANVYSSTGEGSPRFRIIYTDNTFSDAFFNYSSPTVIKFTSTSGKTISRIAYDYGTNPGILYIKNFAIFEGTNSTYEKYGEQVCTNRLDEQTDAINRTNDYLMDDSNPNIDDNEFTNLFNTVGFNDPLGYLLQLPVQFINQLVSQSNTCQTISLGTLWGVSLSLPCIDIGRIIGQQVWDIIDVLFSVGLLVVIFKNLYQTFANLMTMGGEKEAREKFSMPTPMEFLSIILGGDR